MTGISLKDKLTIVVPTYNRYDYLVRWLSYYQLKRFPCAIKILDSSADKTYSKQLEQLLTDPNVSCQKFDSSTFFVHKIVQGIKSVETPFSVLCADDDFLVPSGLEQCVEFLSNQSDFLSCQGRSILHQLKEDKFLWMPNGLNALSVDQQTPAKRFDFFFPDNYCGYPLYAVHRTDLHKEIWDAADHCVCDWGLSEIFPSSLSVILGKMKILDCFYSSRETNTYNWVDAKAHQRMYSTEKVDQVVTSLAKHIDSNLVREKFNEYFQFCATKMSANSDKIKNKSYLRRSLGTLKECVIRCFWLAKINNPFEFFQELKDLKCSISKFKIDEETQRNFRESYR